tara:strand:+ start:894 stop:1412 length:519 start_codon:yes stop_codon:yes gene_type:complete
MKHLPIYIIIILVVALLFTCNKKPIHTETITTIHDTTVHVDSFTHTDLRVDTVFRLDYDTIIQGVAFDVNNYTYKIKDSLLVGTITATSPIKPIINFDYYIKSFEIKDSTVIIRSDLRGFYYGGELVVQPLLNQAYIGLGYMTKRGDLINLSLGKDFSTNTNLIKAGFYKKF